jgi:hypothetical protein
MTEDEVAAMEAAHSVQVVNLTDLISVGLATR